MAHMTSETARHAGHADILREQLDGTTGPLNRAAAWSRRGLPAAGCGPARARGRQGCDQDAAGQDMDDGAVQAQRDPLPGQG